MIAMRSMMNPNPWHSQFDIGTSVLPLLKMRAASSNVLAPIPRREEPMTLKLSHDTKLKRNLIWRISLPEEKVMLL
jgi:hypothetical protein